MTCYKCGKPAKFSVLMAFGPERWYVPNQGARDPNDPPLVEVWLCGGCARTLDDLVRDFLPVAPDQFEADLPAGLLSHKRNKYSDLS